MLNEAAALFEAQTLAPAADRRLTRRLVDVWARTARGRFPSWSALRERDFGEDWGWMFAVDLQKSAGFPYFVYLGEHLGKLSNIYLTGETDWTMTVLEKAVADMEAAVAAEGPHYRESTLTLCNGRKVLFRAVTAPLADDGETITHVVGAANGRFAPCSLKDA